MIVRGGTGKVPLRIVAVPADQPALIPPCLRAARHGSAIAIGGWPRLIAKLCAPAADDLRPPTRAIGDHQLRSAYPFNGVVETNTAAVSLWRALGLAVIGIVPGAFRHATRGNVGRHVMYRSPVED